MKIVAMYSDHSKSKCSGGRACNKYSMVALRRYTSRSIDVSNLHACEHSSGIQFWPADTPLTITDLQINSTVTCAA